MTNYKIRESRELEVIGYYPQTVPTKRIGYHIDAVDSVHRISFDSFPDFNPNYGLDLHQGSKETDVLDRGNVSFGLVISDKLKTILEKHNLPPHRFYPIQVYDAKQKYYWFYYISNIWNFINFKETEIEVFNNGEDYKTVRVVQFDSREEAMEFKRNMPYTLGMRFRKISFSSHFPNYDLFEITSVQYFTLISERLKSELIREEITGLEIEEFNKVFLP
jgi:hypothetical protein